MIANDTCDDHELLFQKINELITIANNNNKNELVTKMKEIVPEFVSMNSHFNQLDN
jgi:hemerythrin